MAASALRVDERRFKRHKALCVALKVLLNLFLHELLTEYTLLALRPLVILLRQQHCVFGPALAIYDI